MQSVYLNAGREKAVLRRHPWVFSKALQEPEDKIASGTLVALVDAAGKFLAYGIYSAQSQIRLRLLSFDEKVIPDAALIAERVKTACALRQPLMDAGNEGVRLIASEGDLLPGLIADKYGSFIVISISSWAMQVFKDDIIASLRSLFPDCSIYERSATAAAKKEGLEGRRGLICGDLPPDVLYVRENDLYAMPIDIKNGHKTGGYLDQRNSRLTCYQLSAKRSVLNCFSYTGGFCLAALKGHAKSVVNVDVSDHALKLCRDGIVFNHLDPGRCRFVNEDVFAYLRKAKDEGRTFDLVILDPPKFIESKNSLASGCRGYQDINRLGLSLVKKGGYLLTFSCSGLMTPDLFSKIVADAALDAGVDGRITRLLRQDCDHTVSLTCPESFYLKGLVVAVN